jgi:hypothetical protein
MAFRKFVQAGPRKFSQEMRIDPKFKFACCDCGLVHEIILGTTMKVRRHKRATAARRKELGMDRKKGR